MFTIVVLYINNSFQISRTKWAAMDFAETVIEFKEEALKEFKGHARDNTVGESHQVSVVKEGCLRRVLHGFVNICSFLKFKARLPGKRANVIVSPSSRKEHQV